MVQPGDEIVFPEVGTIEDPATGREVSGDRMVSDRVVEVSPRDEGGFTPLAGEGEIGLRLEERGRTSLSDIGSRLMGDEVTEDDVFIRDSRTEPGTAFTGFGGDLRALEFERQQPTGRFAPADTRPDGSVPPDRAPDGRFVSPDREPIEDIGRRENDGLFDLF